MRGGARLRGEATRGGLKGARPPACPASGRCLPGGCYWTRAGRGGRLPQATTRDLFYDRCHLLRHFLMQGGRAVAAVGIVRAGLGGQLDEMHALVAFGCLRVDRFFDQRDELRAVFLLDDGIDHAVDVCIGGGLQDGIDELAVGGNELVGIDARADDVLEIIAASWLQYLLWFGRLES